MVLYQQLTGILKPKVIAPTPNLQCANEEKRKKLNLTGVTNSDVAEEVWCEAEDLIIYQHVSSVPVVLGCRILTWRLHLYLIRCTTHKIVSVRCLLTHWYSSGQDVFNATPSRVMMKIVAVTEVNINYMIRLRIYGHEHFCYLLYEHALCSSCSPDTTINAQHGTAHWSPQATKLLYCSNLSTGELVLVTHYQILI